jgi:hypothetical protein
VTKVTKDPVGLAQLADYTGTGGAPGMGGTANTGTSYQLLVAGGGPIVGATASLGDWILVGLLVCWIVWVIYENHNGPWRSKKGSDDLD